MDKTEEKKEMDQIDLFLLILKIINIIEGNESLKLRVQKIFKL